MTTSEVLIVDYGLCNLDSVKRAVELCGASVECTDDPARAKGAARIVLPGVGSFSDAMMRMRRSGWEAALKEEVGIKRIPLLGICLGMQMLANEGVEGGGGAPVSGLGLIEGSVQALQISAPTERVPHVGWNELHPARPHPMWEGIAPGKDFYFVHSFHFVPQSPDVVAGTTDYCGGFVSAVAKNNIFGVQFHPEKSQKIGHRFLKNFLHWNGQDA